eukprot:364423-Chlamydomonas_euryale.AAC.2
MAGWKLTGRCSVRVSTPRCGHTNTRCGHTNRPVQEASSELAMTSYDQSHTCMHAYACCCPERL